MLLALTPALAFVLAGCATLQPPKPWEKDRLAQPEMQFGADPLDAKQTQHIYRQQRGGDRRQRRRWWWLWLQLKRVQTTATPRPRRKKTARPARFWPPRWRFPAFCPATALAQLTPDPGLIELKYLDYRDWQPGADRMRVTSPSFLRAQAPVGLASSRGVDRL